MLLLVLYDFSVVMIGDGTITYRVRLTSAVPILDAGATVYSRPEEAEPAAQTRAPQDLRIPVPPDALAGEPFEVEAWFTIRQGALGFRHSRVQQNGLLVVAVLVDGRRVAKVVELPDGRESREVTVALD